MATALINLKRNSLLIARIDMDTKEVKILSIPRDTYSYVPVENKKDKINHAYAYGSLKNKGVESEYESNFV